MVPQTKVFVGSLPQGSKPEDLRKVFERFGVVTECDIMNRCGFVHMQTEDQAGAAIRALHNSTFNGATITVERGRMKERGQRGDRGGGRGGGRGGMRNGMERRGGGPMRGGMRDAPYSRDRPPRGDMRGPSRGPGGMGGGYDRGMERAPAPYEDRYGGYGGEDRRGFALMDGGRGRPDPYAAQPAMYDDHGGYGAPAPVDDIPPMYGDDRRGASMYGDEREMDRRPPMRGPPMGGYDRAPPRQGMGNGDMYSRRSDMGGSGGYDRDPYAQQYPPMPRGGAARGGRDMAGAPPRRY